MKTGHVSPVCPPDPAATTDHPPLEGAVARVSGASSSIGEGTVRALTELGASVAAVARRQERLAPLAADLTAGRCLAVAADGFERAYWRRPSTRRSAHTVDLTDLSTTLAFRCAGRSVIGLAVSSLPPIEGGTRGPRRSVLGELRKDLILY
jgi:hypothetical protein